MNIPRLSSVLAPYDDELIAFRRDLHAHPELGYTEVRTSGRVFDRLVAAGLRPQPMTGGSGVVCDLGPDGPMIALRGDLDALPLPDECGRPWVSTVPGVAHACGHDVHTTGLLFAGLMLADLHRAGRLPGRVRLIFQPAEEQIPGGALQILAQGVLDGVERAYALHCDPHTDVGLVGSRVGAITAAADEVTVRLTGHGGHTSRPYLTQDVVFALAQVVTGLPAALSRRIDPRAGASMVWGRINAGSVHNVIPAVGEISGTFRVLDSLVWGEASALITDIVTQIVEPYGVKAEVRHVRGVPPTLNEASCVAVAEAAVRAELGDDSVVPTPQSMGGEDFGWFLEQVPGAMVRLGTRTPGGHTYDLHRPDFDVDERSVALAARVLASIALRDLCGRTGI